MSGMNALFNPENIAIIGASNNPSKAGSVIVQNLLRKKYSKKIFPINPREVEIHGLKSYNKLSEIEDKIELVVLITPSSMIYKIMEDLEKRMVEKNDVKAIVCAAADYGETKTEEGIRRENCLLDTAKKYGIRVVGPNCIGVIDNISKVDTTFVETGSTKEGSSIPGGISFISQSGAIASTILMVGDSSPVPIGFNKFISVGNMTDVDFIDLLEYLEEDETTKVIGMYMEGYPKARKLINIMARTAKKKPIVVLKVGRSEKGASAANSHTGSLAGSDKVYDSAFKQYGIIRVETVEELLDTMKAFDRLPLPSDENLFILTQAGGPGIYCTDAVSKHEDINMPVIKTETKEKLIQLLPSMASVCSPEGYADITAAATVKHHVDSLKLLLDDPNVSSVILIVIVPTFLPQIELGEKLSEMYINEGYINRKPVYFTIMAGDYVIPSRETMERKGIYTFEAPDRAVNSANNLIKYAKFKKNIKKEVDALD
ncbi:acetate--CoA ligase family protein [Tissierella praeacuta]|uniref:acetate--CoA ligase family protein n=1 Tax=Tissierella praeacuta TaxID=43131 RepID=UPI003DA46798